MKIKDFLKENQISVGDNMVLLLERIGITDRDLISKIEAHIGESAKMSKSKGNVVDPEEAVERYGADTVRLYILFAAPPDQDFEWTEEGIRGAHRFLTRLWNFVMEKAVRLREVSYAGGELRSVKGKAREMRRRVHETVDGYLKDMERNFQFNTAIAKVMKLFNELSDFSPETDTDWKVLKEGVEVILLLLAPITPHICEELWREIGKEGLISEAPFPEPDREALKVEEVEIPVQVNGKVRARIRVPFGSDEETVKEVALRNERVKAYIDGKEIKRIVYVPNKLLNIVVS
ncbi:MAG: class I tRNA ligase family protein [Aquificota bacterium]|nr:class I tRNA ligase family protein [Aquificota bacterium]